MADEYPYIPPEFLQGQSADDIHRRMMDNLPAGIDRSEGNIPWDFTRPAAVEKAEMIEFVLNEVIQQIFPQWSKGEWLNLHGERENVTRRPANPASGTLTVRGVPGTAIPAGYQFATAANLTSSVIFAAMEDVTLEGSPDSKGLVEVQVPVQAVKGGTEGNVAADTISLMVRPLRGITYVTNPEAMTGGVEAESDGSYLSRILASMRTGASMTGCVADYIRWAKEVPGVGQVVVEPEWDDPSLPAQFHYLDGYGSRRCAGAVRLIIIDSNGIPANRQLLDAVYLHIAGTGDDDPARPMPIGAHLTVTAPEPLRVDIAATVLLEPGADILAVTERFRAALDSYWLEVGQDAAVARGGGMAYIRLVQVGAALAKSGGVESYSGLTVSGGTVDIPVARLRYPVTGEVELHVQT